jgi:hypothetical protein
MLLSEELHLAAEILPICLISIPHGSISYFNNPGRFPQGMESFHPITNM